MDAQLQHAYNRLREHIDPDLLRIDEHLMQLPQHLMEACEHASDAARVHAESKAILATVQAEVANRLRTTSEKKPAVAEVEALVAIDEEVINATASTIEAQHDKDKWNNLVDALRTKGSVMKTSAELIISGYLAPRAVVDSGRAQRQRAKEAAG